MSPTWRIQSGWTAGTPLLATPRSGPPVADGGGLSPHSGTGPAGGRGGGAARHRPWHRPGSGRPAGRGRAQNSAGLQKLARRISPRATWEDLVLPVQRRPPAALDRRTGAPTGTGLRRVAAGLDVVPCPRRDGPLRGRQRYGQNHVGRGRCPQPRPGPLRHRPLHGGGQVHRRDGEKPGPHLR